MVLSELWRIGNVSPIGIYQYEHVPTLSKSCFTILRNLGRARGGQ